MEIFRKFSARMSRHKCKCQVSHPSSRCRYRLGEGKALRYFFNLIVLAQAMLLFSVADAKAQSQEEELALVYGDKENVSIATGSKQPIIRAPSTATVITAQDIRAMGMTDLEQVLESVPGLHVSMVHVGLNPIYIFRGIAAKYNPQVLMLVNGIPITNVFWGDRSQIWGGFPLENVARIEVIRGPGSALYGADAFAGVINIITRTAADIHGTEAGVRLGSFNSKDVWVQHGGQLGAADASYYLRAGNTDGAQGIIEKDVQSTIDQRLGTHASLTPGTMSTSRKALDARTDIGFDAWRIRAAYQKREIGMGAGLAGNLDPYSRGNSSRFYIDTNYDQANWVPNWDVSAVIGYFANREWGSPAYRLFPPGAFNGAFPQGMIGNPGHAERHGQVELTALYTGFEQNKIRVGTGYKKDDLYAAWSQKNFYGVNSPLPGVIDVTNDPTLIYMIPHKRILTYVFVQDEWGFANDWMLTAGIRHDRYSDFGSTTNPRLALVWNADYNKVVKLMHGTAFRAPSFAEQYSINNPVVIGDPNVKPEKLVSDELAFSWQTTTDWQNNLNFFRYRMRSIILPVAAVYSNSGDRTGKGFELESTLDVSSNIRLNGSVSVQHSHDEASGKDAGIAPQRRLFARADWRVVPFWQLGLVANHVAARMREPGDTRPQVPDYTMVDVTLRREKLMNGIEVSAKVSNLLNQSAWEPTFLGLYSDLPLPKRAFYIQMQVEI